MSENEQRPSSDDIDNTPGSSAEGDGNQSDSEFESIPLEKVSEPEQVKVESIKNFSAPAVDAAQERTPLVQAGNNGVTLIIAGIVAAIMTVAFIMGAEAIFPRPASESPAPETTTSPAPTTSTPAEAPATSTPKKPAADETPKPATSSTEKSDQKQATPAEGADPKKASPPASGSAAHEPAGAARAQAPLLLASTVKMAKSEDTAAAEDSASRPNAFFRFVLLIKLAILICVATVCGLVVLGGMALAQDRPLGDYKTALCKLFACSWVATLALLVPSPSEWLQAAIHYVVGVAIFWVVTLIWFRLSPRSTTVLLGGTMALLAATALGARLVVWATWT